MNEAFYLVSSFWLGALHAATPGHGKTIAAAYIVGARGRPVDALVLGIFVTLSHTSGIVLVAVLATFGSAWFLPQRVEAYVSVMTGLLVIGMGVWLLWIQPTKLPAHPQSHHHDHGPHHHGDAGDSSAIGPVEEPDGGLSRREPRWGMTWAARRDVRSSSLPLSSAGAPAPGTDGWPARDRARAAFARPAAAPSGSR